MKTLTSIIMLAMISTSKKVKKESIIFIYISLYRHPKVVVKFPRTWDGKHLKCKEVKNKLESSSWMSGVTFDPPLTDFGITLSDTDKAVVKAKTHVSGAAETKNNAITAEMNTVNVYAGNVQGVCYKNPNSEKEITDSCGLFIVEGMGGHGYDFNARATEVDGELEILGRVKKEKGTKPLHDFQISSDPSIEQKWLERIIPTSKKAKVKVQNCAVNQKIYIRYRWILDGIPQAWSDVISITLYH